MSSYDNGDIIEEKTTKSCGTLNSTVSNLLDVRKGHLSGCLCDADKV